MDWETTAVVVAIGVLVAYMGTLITLIIRDLKKILKYRHMKEPTDEQTN